MAGIVTNLQWGESFEGRLAEQEAEGRYRLHHWRTTPHLARTKNAAIIQPPPLKVREVRRRWADWIAENLPEFVWDYERGYWQAPLEMLIPAWVLLERATGTVYRPITSDGARAYLETSNIYREAVGLVAPLAVEEN